jgi:signal transduction histidine kinase
LKISVEFHTTGLKEKRLSPDIEINLYRIVQEALNNVSKHAKANNVSVLLEGQGKSVVLIIEDDGIGFETGESEKLNRNDKGMGLFGMKERVLLVGGTIEIESSIKNGTTIYVRIPIQLNDEKENKLCRN